VPIPGRGWPSSGSPFTAFISAPAPADRSTNLAYPFFPFAPPLPALPASPAGWAVVMA
jgi:hypothetical protein